MIRIDVETKGEIDPSPRVERRDGCVLVYTRPGLGVSGSVIHDLGRELPEDAVLCPHAARIHGAYLAAGRQADLEHLALDGVAGIRRHKESREELADFKLPTGAVEWHATGVHGYASMAIFEHMSGYRFGAEPETRHPVDYHSMKLCVGLLDAVQDWRRRIGEMADISREWEAVTKEWGSLTTLVRAAGYFEDEQGRYAAQLVDDLLKPFAVPRQGERMIPGKADAGEWANPSENARPDM